MIAGYIRVSSAEQANRGYSLPAQKELILRYAKESGEPLYKIYADEGKSANKALNRRKALLEMLDDAEAGKFQRIVFKDFTRWSRNNKQYYAVQDRLDKAGVSWFAIQQPHLETETPTGRFFVSVVLSTAQLESEQTGERIKTVFDSKILNKTVIFGTRQCPLGYKVENHKMFPDPQTAQIARDMFAEFLRSGNVQKTTRWLFEQGIRRYEASVRRYLANEIYVGKFRGVEGFTEPLISQEDFDTAQRLLQRRSYTPVRNDAYIFSSLLKCSICGRSMTGCKDVKSGRYWYMCKFHRIHPHECEHTRTIRQDFIEAYLLENIDAAMDEFAVEIKKKNTPDSTKKRYQLQHKLTRLNDLYVDGEISRQQYNTKKQQLQSELDALPPEQAKAQLALKPGWKNVYQDMTPAQRKAFWRSVIRSIDIDNENNMVIHFAL